MSVTIVKADGAHQADRVAQQAGQILDSGGLVVFPTETVYGVAAAGRVDSAVEALRGLKDRPAGPFTVHIAGPAEVRAYLPDAGSGFFRLIDKLMPGPVTVVARMGEQMLEQARRHMGLSPKVAAGVLHEGTVGLRCPAHDLARQVLAAADGPVLATSANQRGRQAPVDAESAAEVLAAEVDLIIDGGRSRFAKGSTIVAVNAEAGPRRLEVLREGVYDERTIRRLAVWRLLIVCSGNTCRSPMAAGLARTVLAEQEGVEADALGSVGLDVQSAGTAAMPGAPVSPEAVGTMDRWGIDISGHRSQPLTPELTNGADLILCMTEQQRRRLIELDSTAIDKVHTLDPHGDVDDPIGSGPTGYLRCAEIIRRRLEHRLRELARKSPARES